jgi:hypothetical protein
MSIFLQATCTMVQYMGVVAKFQPSVIFKKAGLKYCCLAALPFRIQL